MAHLEREALRQILGGEGGLRDAESAEEHLLSCERCRALAAALRDELGVESPGGPLQLVFDLIDRERRWGLESLSALAEWTELRRLPSRRSQRERVRMSKACHKTAFFRLVLGELKEESSWEESEFLAGLALLSVEAMSQRRLISPASCRDLQAEVWTAVANSRRKAAEWTKAHQALANAERCLKEGSGNRLLKAGLLSITASTLADQGQVSQALEALERCRALYDSLSEGALLARTLVQQANVLAGIDPAQGLEALDRARPLIPVDDPQLKLAAEMLRVECLIEVSEPGEALGVYRHSSHLLAATPQVRTRIRGRFTSARLLDALGLRQQAERLFNEVVDSDIEHELYKDAFLDLLYLYERHVKSGEVEKAARVCRRALTDPSLSGVAHEQLRDLWTQLLEAAHSTISHDLLRELRQYLNTHWKQPAAVPPVVARRS